MSEQLMTIAEAAVWLGRSSITVVRYIKAGRLPAVRMGLGPRAPLFVPEHAVVALKEAMRQSVERRERSGR